MAGTASDPGTLLRARSRAVLREWLWPSPCMPRRFWPPALGLLYIGGLAAFGQLRLEHVFIGLLGLLDVYNEKSRRFLAVFYPFIITGVVFDLMRYVYWQGIAGRVHVAEPYELERRWFAIGGRTLNEIFLEHHHVVLDVVCGLAYLTFVAEYLALGFYLFFRGRHDHASALSWCFFVMNAMGFATYFIYPAAPPWYLTQYGPGPPVMNLHPAPAAAGRFDALIGVPLFASIYDRGVDVFGAMPSLHVAYPFCATVLAFMWPELRWARWPAAAFFLLICLSAVYLQHHYVLDEILGVVYALIAVAVVRGGQRWWARRRSGNLSPRAPGARTRGPSPRRTESSSRGAPRRG